MHSTLRSEVREDGDTRTDDGESGDAADASESTDGDDDDEKSLDEIIDEYAA